MLRKSLQIIPKNLFINKIKPVQLSARLSISSTNLVQSENKKTSAQTSKFKIYTKTGDKGKSSLYTGERRVKNDVIFDALGDTDELNSTLGLAREFCLEITNKDVSMLAESQLIKVQSILLDIGSHIATPRTNSPQKQLDRLANFDENLIKELELWIDEFDKELPTLKNFILPSGGKFASTVHMCRSICRRAERSLQPLLQSKDLDSNVCVYMNRLSDYLFTLARFAALKEEKNETIYKKP